MGDGWISVFDNRNSALGGSRFWMLQPHTGKRRQIYPTSPDGGGDEREFFTNLGGKAQRLADGDWLLTEAQFGRVFEIDASGRTVWEWGIQRRADGETISEVMEDTSYPFSSADVARWRPR
jgi:hypothetical protein